jgi:NADPH:quinone reductase-like Zn-dependent oxidoreductase
MTVTTLVKSGEKVKTYELAGDFGIKALVINEITAPELKSHEVRIKIRATSLNFRDLMMITGVYNPNLKKPAVPLSDGAGEIVEVGDAVTRVKVGDRVMGIFMQKWLSGRPNVEAARSSLGGGGPKGMLAESVVLHEDGVVHVPEHLSFEEAATLPCAAVTAWHALVTTGQIKPGDTVLTQGTGGVSIFAAQFALAAGARVIGTSSSDEKLQKLKKLGVSDLINYKKTPEWGKEVLKLTGGQGVDHVVEVGGAGTLAESLKAVRMAGQISVIGVLSGVESTVGPTPILVKSVRMQGIFVGSREMFEAMNAAISLHKIKPVVDKVFSFEQAKEALQYMESGSHFGKIVIKV